MSQPRQLPIDVLDAVSVRHRELAAAVGAAAEWALAIAEASADLAARDKAREALRPQPEESRSADRDTSVWPAVVWPEYGSRLDELHGDLAIALLGGSAFMVECGFSRGNSLEAAKGAIEAAWREDREARSYAGELKEAAAIHAELLGRAQKWAAEVRAAPQVLLQAGMSAVWLRTYRSSTWDRAQRAVEVLQLAMSDAASVVYHPTVAYEWARRFVEEDPAALMRRGIADQAGFHRVVDSRVAFHIDRWLQALVALGLPQSDQDRTIRALEAEYESAVAAWRRLCSYRAPMGSPAVPAHPHYPADNHE